MRTFTHTHTGPTTLALDLGDADVRLLADPTAQQAEIIIAPAVADDTVAADLIKRATATSTTDRFTLTIPRPPGHRFSSVQQFGGGVHNVQFFARGGGTVIQSAGNITMVNGRIVSGNATVVTPGGRLLVAVRVPADSVLTVDTDAATVATHGRLTEVDYTSVSGDLSVDRAQRVTAGTTSGDITTQYSHTARLRTISGDIRVSRVADLTANTVSGDARVAALAGTADINTISGDIRVTAVTNSTVHAHAVSGDITVNAADGIAVSGNARSVSGRERVPSGMR